MAESDRTKRIHNIATRHSTAMVTELLNAGVPWTDIIIAAETVVAILLATGANMSGTESPVRWATEMVDALTERAHARALAVLTSAGGSGNT